MAAPAIHPGEHLAEELKTLDMSAAELARKLHVPTNRITQILNGQRAITGDTALRLAHFFGTSPEFWLNLQSLYELRLAQQKAGKAIKALPTLKRTEPVRQKTYDLRKLLKAIPAKNQPKAIDFGPPQGKEVW
jgi:addiction module HigA family antidote